MDQGGRRILKKCPPAGTGAIFNFPVCSQKAIFSARNSGAAAPSLWASGFLVLSAENNPIPIEFIVLGRGGFGFFGREGGSANFNFLGARICPKVAPS